MRLLFTQDSPRSLTDKARASGARNGGSIPPGGTCSCFNLFDKSFCLLISFVNTSASFT